MSLAQLGQAFVVGILLNPAGSYRADRAQSLYETGLVTSSQVTEHLTDHQHNFIVVLMIPQLDPCSGYLPPGLHPASWMEVVPCFATNSHRKHLLSGLEQALRNFSGAGCRTVLLDGSFVSVKVLPRDYDAAWEPVGVDPALLDPVLLDFSRKRAAMKLKYGGEFFPATALAVAGALYRDFFQKDKNGVPKGVIEIDLGSLP
jgi:hypothetical protein